MVLVSVVSVTIVVVYYRYFGCGSGVRPSVGNTHSASVFGVEDVHFDESRSEKFAHLDFMDYWVGTDSGSRCKHVRSVLLPGVLNFYYAVNTHYV